MTKLTLPLVVASLAGLVSCVDPDPPPSHRHPRNPPPYGPVAPDTGTTIVDPPAPQPQPEPPPPTATGGYPTAQRTANPDQVLSPYEPYNVIDVAGFKTGQLARDPSNQKIFRVP